jgi:hypothetical protein
MPKLTDRLRNVLTNARRELHPDERVHFHSGENGRAYVCENPRCSSPGLTTAG